MSTQKSNMTKVQCEQCGQLMPEEKANIYHKRGYDETVTLAFCDECWKHE